FLFFFFFFFFSSRRRHTRSDRDWSSDVCSSDLGVPRFEISNYSEHALSSGEEAAAISYIQIKTADGKSRWGAGVDTNIEIASVRSEERRVGKEGRCGGARDDEKRKKKKAV